MIFMADIYTESSKLSNVTLDLILNRISAHIAEVFVRIAAKNLVNGSGQTIGNSHFGFIGGPKPTFELSIFGSVIRSLFVLSAVSSLDEKLS
jgi:hypothetical protein